MSHAPAYSANLGQSNLIGASQVTKKDTKLKNAEFNVGGDVYSFEEDIVSKLNKIDSLLQVIDNSVSVMNKRIDTNEEALNSVAKYIEEKYSHNPLH